MVLSPVADAEITVDRDSPNKWFVGPPTRLGSTVFLSCFKVTKSLFEFEQRSDYCSSIGLLTKFKNAVVIFN